MKVFFKILRWGVLAVVLLVAVLLALVTCFEQRVPDGLVDRLSAALSSSNAVVRIDSVHFRLPHRVRLGRVRVFDLSRPSPEPMLSAAGVDVRLRLLEPPWEWRNAVRSVTITELKYPRLPEGYYVPDSVEFPGQPDFREKNEPLEFVLPEMRHFKLKLIRPDILSIRPLSLVGEVEIGRRRAMFSNATLEWPDTDARMTLDCHALLDLDHQVVRGAVRGQSRQRNIRPLLEALEISNSYQFIDAFTRVNAPVDAGCAFTVNLRNNDLRILLDLHPSDGFYRGAPFRNADGTVDVNVFVRDVYQNARIVVGPLGVVMGDGGQLGGTVIYENTNDQAFVHFDARSTTSISNTLAVANVLNDGTLDCLRVTDGPEVTLRGVMAVDPANAASNDLRGTLSFARGSFLGIPLSDVRTEFSFRGTDVRFVRARARSAGGGWIEGTGGVSCPGFSERNASFDVSVNGRKVPLSDLAEVFSCERGDRSGFVSGRVKLSGPLGSDVTKLDGEGRLTCSDGRLARLRLFAGLTDFLAKKVPGVAQFVDQSDAQMSFTIRNGRFVTDDLNIRGAVFSISGKGAYDIQSDELDFTVRVELVRDDSLMGKLASPIAWTFSKLLLEFKVFGPIGNPDWKYLTVLDKIVK